MTMQLNDDLLAGVSLDHETHAILLAAAHHDTAALKDLLRTGSANVQDPETGCTPLHAAIGACAPTEEVVDNELSTASEACEISKAEETVRLLFENGAIWNDLDTDGETPGCLAWRLRLTTLYNLVVDAGVRAEILLNRLDAFELLDDGNEDEDGYDRNLDDNDSENSEKAVRSSANANATAVSGPGQHTISASSVTNANSECTPIHTSTALEAAQTAALALRQPQNWVRVHDDTEELSQSDELNTSNPAFLASRLTVRPSVILDADASGVMMDWETSLMEKTADLIVPSAGLRILNIGHGMGIVDDFFAGKRPASHHIIEAHPDVLAALRTPETGFLAVHPTATLYDGRWQDVVPKLLDAGETYDAIFYDTFAEDYIAFREFSSEYVIGLLAPEGRWSFFNGMGADRRVCYDVYSKVAELDLEEAGFDVEWANLQVPNLTEDFEGVRRSYFTLDEYKLPVCRFLS